MNQSIQRLERTVHYDMAICCTYCGTKVVTGGDEDHALNPCLHTLFIASDEGFEYLAPAAADQLRERGFSVDDDGFIQIDTEDQDVPDLDTLTDGLSFSDAFKIASYVAPPGGMGFYVGFAPDVDERT